MKRDTDNTLEFQLDSHYTNTAEGVTVFENGVTYNMFLSASANNGQVTRYPYQLVMNTCCINGVTYAQSEATVEMPWGRETEYLLYDDFSSSCGLDFPTRRLVCRTSAGEHSLSGVTIGEGIFAECPVEVSTDALLTDLWTDAGATLSPGDEFEVGSIETTGKFHFTVSGYDNIINLKLTIEN
jgi:hypothetical protein